MKKRKSKIPPTTEPQTPAEPDPVYTWRVVNLDAEGSPVGYHLCISERQAKYRVEELIKFGNYARAEEIK